MPARRRLEAAGSIPPSSPADDADHVAADAGDTAAPVEAARRAVALDPDHAGHRHRLGRALERHGDLQAAASALADALARDGDRAAWYFQLGNIRQQLDDWAAAAVAYQAAVDREPTHAVWHARLGGARKRLRDWPGAADAYHAAVLRDGSHPTWFVQLGHAHERAGDWSRATAAYRRADEVTATKDPDAPPPTSQLPIERRAYLSLVRKPQYAYGLYRAATLASKLGVPRIAAVELGVAGGNGLVALERHAADLTASTGVEIDVVGFDTGSGLFEPVDYRDMPYMFAAGNYAIDLPRLESRLQGARLVLGDAGETFGAFLGEDGPPIGFLSFDMDVYSATSAVLASLGDAAEDRWVLPRTSVYFDDVYGFQGQDYNRFTGELLAIDEFNAANHDVKFAEDRTFRTLPVNVSWHHGMYTLHRFHHPEYGTYVSPAGPTSLQLREG